MFHRLPNSAWADGNLAEATGMMVEHTNQSQPNPVPRADGTPCSTSLCRCQDRRSSGVRSTVCWHKDRQTDARSEQSYWHIDETYISGPLGSTSFVRAVPCGKGMPRCHLLCLTRPWRSRCTLQERSLTKPTSQERRPKNGTYLQYCVKGIYVHVVIAAIATWLSRVLS